MTSPPITSQKKMEALVIRVSISLRQQHRARAVPEEDARPSIIPVENLREGIRSNNKRMAKAFRVSLHHAVRHIQGIHETGANRVHIKGGTQIRGQTDFFLDHTTNP